jgi:hypothetical protein
MKKGWFWLALFAVASMLQPLERTWAKTEFFRIEDLRPGMKGVGKTCYQGTRPEEFQVEVLGVLDGINPGASAVLVRLNGGMMDRTGVFEGMSGSPVYIDGKLLGAIAYSFSFAREAICGIAPITQMVSAFEEQESPSGTKAIFKKSVLQNYRWPVPEDLSGSRVVAVTAGDVSRQPSLAAFGGHSLVPIATPLSLGGFSAETLKIFAPTFRAMGLSTLQGTGSAGPGTAPAFTADSDGSSLEPGSNIVIPLVSGDLDVSAGGTVTYVDGSKLYAFGHSLFDLGFTELPMHRGTAITVFPSLQSSFKILATGAPAGTIRQDRGMGIYGIVGEKPRLVPLKVHLTTSRGIKRELKYELARDPYLTPLLVNLTVYNTIVASERALGYATLSVKGQIKIKNEQPVVVDNRFSSDSDTPAAASLSIALPVNYLMTAGYKNLDLEGIDLEIVSHETDQAAVLDAIRFDSTEVRAGESLELEIFYKKANGDVLRDKYPVRIPANASPGPLTMLVADGTALMSLDDQEEREGLIPRDLTQLIRFINNLRKTDRLYVRFFRQEPGVAVKGEGLPGLPPSFLSILKSERKAGALIPIRTSTLMEYEVPAVEHMITGAKILRLLVKP